MADALASRAYENIALPIGHGQTISQPYIVALMTQLLLDVAHPVHKVLEIGTGCGYQTAVLASLCGHVYSMERIELLMWEARNRLYDLKFKNTTLIHADGHEGCEENAPFDGILAAAASARAPRRLLEQLREGARLVLPLECDGQQQLTVITRDNNAFIEQPVAAVRFVSFKRGILRQ